MQGSDFVAKAEATSVDGSQECDILPEPVCRELSDDTKVKFDLPMCHDFGSGPFRRGAFKSDNLGASPSIASIASIIFSIDGNPEIDGAKCK